MQQKGCHAFLFYVVTSNKLGCDYVGQGQGLGLSPELHTAIDKFIQDNKVVLFMKGNRMFPQCGFSNTCVQVQSIESAMPMPCPKVLSQPLISADTEYTERAI